MRSGARNLLIGFVIAFLLLLVGGRMVAEFAVDLWWYRSLGLEDLFWTRWYADAALRTVAALIVGAVVFVNLGIVARTLGAIRVRRRYGNLEIAEQLPPSFLRRVLLAVAATSAWILSAAVDDGIGARAALRPAQWGIDDPVFGRDLSFYVFQLPFIDGIQGFLAALVFWVLLLVTAAYVATGGVRWSESSLHASIVARRHLAVLVAVLFAILAADAWLDRYAVLIAGSAFGGAVGYTDVIARIPAKAMVAGLALVAAATVAYGGWKGAARPPVFGVGALIVGALIGEVALPALVQRLRVEPDQFAREAPFIAWHLQFTRAGFGLDALEQRPLAVGRARLPSESRLRDVLAGVPLWDTRPLLQAWAPQALFGRYSFLSAHVDRYGPPGAEEQVAIAVRELEADSLPPSSRTWENLRLLYTRGEGAVVSPTARMSGGGEPIYYVRDLPSRLIEDAPPSLQITNGAVYFGEKTESYAILRPPSARRAAGVAGADAAPPPDAGVPLDGLWKRLAFAWAFQSKNILLADDLTRGSRIIYRRQIRERAARIAPFLLFLPGALGDAYPIIDNGRIVWMLDGFTAARAFPFSVAAPLGNSLVRYARASTKLTVDALTGELRVYAMDEADPVLQTYRRIFPDLFRPVAAMPADLHRHLRYPAPLMELQARVLQEYHLRDARAFYAREDVWAVPTELYRNAVIPYRPFYAILPLPGESETEFLLAAPFVAQGRQNMTALLVARNDPPNYGEKILYELPRDVSIPGPQQVEAMIDQDPEISEQLTLWKSGGSDVIRGRLVTVPLDSTLVYVEPIYLESQESALPQLERIIVVAGDRVVMRPTLEGAISALLDLGAGEGAEPAAEPGGEEGDATSATAALDPRLSRARRLMEEAEAHLRAGDWAAFGATWQQIRETLRAVPAVPPRTP